MLSATRRLPRAVGVSARLYTSGSKLLGVKERAEEEQYACSQEMAQLAKLRAYIEAKKKELSELEKDADAIDNKTTPKS